MATRSLTLRRPDTCVSCAAALPAGAHAWWDRNARTVTCSTCHASIAAPVAKPDPVTSEEFDRGRPGGSLAREYERRRSRRELATKQAHPHVGGLLLALREPPQHDTAFWRGEQGEIAVAQSLETRTAQSPALLLYNRRMPKGRGDIDVIAIAPAGVFVIDAKDITGRVRVQRPWFGEPSLLVNGRDRTNLIDGLDRQLRAVRAALDSAGAPDIPLHGVLCFTRADLPLIGTSQIRGHQLIYRKALAKRLNAAGPMDAVGIDQTARVLAAALPPA